MTTITPYMNFMMMDPHQHDQIINDGPYKRIVTIHCLVSLNGPNGSVITHKGRYDVGACLICLFHQPEKAHTKKPRTITCTFVDAFTLVCMRNQFYTMPYHAFIVDVCISIWNILIDESCSNQYGLACVCSYMNQQCVAI